MIALERIENKRLIGLGNLEIGEAAAVGEIKLGHDSLHTQAWKLRVHLDVYTFIRLYADDKLVAGNVCEYATGNVLELDPNLGLLLIQSY